MASILANFTKVTQAGRCRGVQLLLAVDKQKQTMLLRGIQVDHSKLFG